MSHRDKPVFRKPPPGFTALGPPPAHRRSPQSRTPPPAASNGHPVSTPRSCTRLYGQEILHALSSSPEVCGLRAGPGRPASIVEDQSPADSHARWGEGRTSSAASPAAFPTHRSPRLARPSRDRRPGWTCVFVDHGLMRKGTEGEAGDQALSVTTFQGARSSAGRRRGERFSGQAQGRSPRPEAKAQGRSGAEFIRGCSRRRPPDLAGPDGRGRPASSRCRGRSTFRNVIESGGGTGAATIKSHPQTSAGCPDGSASSELIEPLARACSRTEVRARSGAELGLPRAAWSGASRSPAPDWRSAWWSGGEATQKIA